MTLSKIQMEAINDYCEETGNVLYKDYSGRGMYGRNCVGYVTEANVLSDFAYFMLHISNSCPDDEEFFSELIDNVKQDSMGKSGTILYFPDVVWDESEFEDDSDEELECNCGSGEKADHCCFIE